MFGIIYKMCDYARFLSFANNKMPEDINPSPEIEKGTEKFDSITHFLQTGGFMYSVFDMGRKVDSISNVEFERIEGQQAFYPAPFQKKASVALLFWEPEKQAESVIWFLQFPIDEMGYLKQEARDAFLIDLLEQTGKNIQAKQQGKSALDELNESPFAFKPNPDRLAMFHALATKRLEQSPSNYYNHTQDYLSGTAGYEQWQFLGLQGVADIVARLDEDNNEALLAEALGEMPEAPLVSFCSALENVHPKSQLTEALISKLKITLQAGSNNQLVAMLVRAISGALPEKMRDETLQLVLTSKLGSDIEVMAAISGRAWNALYSPPVLAAFMTNLGVQTELAFNAILADLMMIPSMRELIFSELKNHEQSADLNEKLSQFMKTLTI